MDDVTPEIGIQPQPKKIEFQKLNPREDLQHFWGWQNVDWFQEEGVGEVTRIQVPKGKVKSVNDIERPVGAGFQLREGIVPADNMALEYDIRFPKGFDFVKGGKLPGLFGGNAPTGGEAADGTNGFTSRLMWREGGNGEVYLYAPHDKNGDEDNPWGTSVGRGAWKFSPDGNWHKVKQEIKLNTPGQNNGLIRIFYDGEPVLEKADVYFRDTVELKAEGLYFSVFFGGNDETWASTADSNIDFANFAIES